MACMVSYIAWPGKVNMGVLKWRRSLLGRFKLLILAILGMAVAMSLCTLALKPAIPALAYSIYSPCDMEEGVGVVIIAPYGDDAWGEAVLSVARDIDGRFPTEVAFGESSTSAIQLAVEKLKSRGVDRVIMIPLLTSSNSLSVHKMRYVLGLERSSDPLQDAAHTVSLDVPFVVGRPMDSSPLLASVISDTAKKMSGPSRKGSLVVVADALQDNKDGRLWDNGVAKLSSAIKAESGFRKVIFISAPGKLPAGPESELYRTVKMESAKGVVVVPLSMGDSDLHRRIVFGLRGLDYQMNPKPLLTHPKVIEWLKESIDKQLILINWKQIVDDDLVMET